MHASDAVADVPALVAKLYAVVDHLESLFPGRPFTPDGHLVGSLGEVLAAHAYGLELLPPSHAGHDAKARDGRLIQIKATQVRRVALSSEPEHLLVLRIYRDGSFAEEYNGPGSLAWKAAGRCAKNGQRPIALSKLRGLMVDVDPADRVPRP